MVFDWSIKLANVTLPVATIFCSTWALVSGHTDGAVYLFLGGMIFTILLRMWEEDFYVKHIK